MKKQMKNKYTIINCIFAFFLIIIVYFITYGFAFYEQLITFSGNITVIPDGKLEITDITIIDKSNVINSEIPTFTDNNINFNITFNGNDENYYIIYSANIVNNSSYDYLYNGFELVPIVNSDNGGVGILSLEISGIEEGHVIAAKETIIVTLKLVLSVDDTDQTYDANGNINIGANVQDGGELLASLETITNDLRGDKELAEIKLSLINTFSKSINFDVVSTNSNFYFADADGNKLNTLTIAANSTEEYTIYLKISDASFFSTKEDSTVMKLICDTISNKIVGEINLLVDITTIIDNEIPSISSIDINGNSVSGSSATIDVSWTGNYNGTAENMTYTILLYNTRTNEVSEINVDSTVYSYTFTITKAGNYYAVVYGTTSDGKTGKDYIGKEESPYYKQSETVVYYSITAKFTNATWSGPTLIKEGDTYSGTALSTTSDYTIPNDMTAYMGGTLLTCQSETGDYWFTGRTARSGNFTLYTPANGDIVLTMVGEESSSGGGGCLVEGTQILLADGNTKNIEDVNYDDLLLVWDYENGSWTYEYPIWIEKPMYIHTYKKITFSDGSNLKIAVDHGLFSYDINQFVAISDEENLKIGTSIAKLNEQRQLEQVTITNIEDINDTVKYYHVVSTKFYNVIANNILTTDDNVILSNLYGFEDKVKWPNYRNEIMKVPNSLYSYDQFSSFLPYYMFKGLRVEEAKILSEYISLEEFQFYLINNQLNENMLLKPIINENDNNMWMVTTSDDIVTSENKHMFMYEEGSIYVLNKVKNEEGFKYWYNTSDGKKYNTGDQIKISHGNHFIAVYDK